MEKKQISVKKKEKKKRARVKTRLFVSFDTKKLVFPITQTRQTGQK